MVDRIQRMKEANLDLGKKKKKREFWNCGKPSHLKKNCKA